MSRGMALSDKIAKLGRRLVSGAFLYLLLKLTNIGLAFMWSMGLTATLVRVVGLESYAEFALVVAFGGYVIATDFGLSRLLYTRMRAAHLNNDPEARRLAFRMFFSLTVLVFLVAAVLFPSIAYAGGFFSDERRLDICLLFVGVIANLPALTIRNASAAVDRYVAYESLEVARRGTIVVGLALVLFAGMPIEAYFILNVAVWLPWYAVMLRVIGRAIELSPRRAFDPRRIPGMRRELSAMLDTAVFWISDFSVYNLPYFVIPILYSDPVRLVVFDVFYKVTRFGQMAFVAIADVVLPQQTRGFHSGERRNIRRGTAFYLVFAGAAALLAVSAVTVFGDLAFKALLGRSDIVSSTYRGLMVAMIAAMFVEFSALSFLMGTGRFTTLRLISTSTFAMTVLVSVGVAALGWPDEAFIAAIVGVYAIGAIATVVAMGLIYRSIEKPKEAPL